MKFVSGCYHIIYNILDGKARTVFLLILMFGLFYVLFEQNRIQNIINGKSLNKEKAQRLLLNKLNNSNTTFAAKVFATQQQCILSECMNLTMSYFATPVTTPFEFMIAASYFQLTYEAKQFYIKLLREFDNICSLNNITYFLHAGSLIGSYMHHGFIPWDDDMDIMMSMNEKDKLKASFANHSLLVLNEANKVGNKMRWKVYHVNESYNIEGFLPHHNIWRFPFIDISFWQNNTSDIIFDGTNPRYKYQHKDVYPIIRRPFESLRLPVPRHGIRYVNWAKKQCCTGHWDHRNEEPSPNWAKRCISCKHLNKVFQFVITKSYNASHQNETLTLGTRIIHSCLELKS